MGADAATAPAIRDTRPMRTRRVPMSLVPSTPGTYVLIMQLAVPAEVEVGKLGTFHLPAGWYAYVGSALGRGGLAGRLGRHRRQHKRLYWHIDYLLSVSQIAEIWWTTSAERWECSWAETLSLVAVTTVPVPGFGSSDCSCPSHLFYSDRRLPLSVLTSGLTEGRTLFVTVLGGSASHVAQGCCHTHSALHLLGGVQSEAQVGCSDSRMDSSP